MEARNLTELSVVKNEKRFVFIAPTDAQLGDCYDSCLQMLQFIAYKIEENTKEQKKNEEANQEEVQSRCC